MPSCFLIRCLLNYNSLPIYFPQCPHLNFDIPPCFLTQCLLNYIFPPIYFPHCPPSNFDIPPCFLILCILNYNLSPVFFHTFHTSFFLPRPVYLNPVVQLFSPTISIPTLTTPSSFRPLCFPLHVIIQFHSPNAILQHWEIKTNPHFQEKI